VDARLAAYEYEALERTVAINQAGRMPTKHWRDAATGFTRTALGGNRRPRGKGVLLLKIKAFLKRSARVTVSVGKAALELASDRKAGGTGLAARAEARAAAQVVDAKANVAKRMASTTMTQYDAAYFATAAAASNPPRLDLGKQDLLNPPSKEILAQECELQGLPVKRSGDDTANPRQATELVQFLVQRLRDFHDGSNNIPKLTSFGAGKKLMSWNSSSGGGVDITEQYSTYFSFPA